MSKDKRVRSSVLNIQGILAYQENRLPEAVYYWKKALRSQENYKPAILNISFIALKYGDFYTAEKMLNSLKNNWFVLYAKAGLYRLIGKLKESRNIYKKLLKTHSQYKPLLFNYGIYLWQENNDAIHAKKFINKSLKIDQGPEFWNKKSWDRESVDGIGWLMSYGFGPRFIFLGMPWKLDYAWEYNPHKGTISDQKWYLSIGLDY